MYFEPKMIKVQTGQIIEFYSNTCKVKGVDADYKCRIQGRIDLVVGDMVNIELEPNGDACEGVVTERLDRKTALYKSKDRTKKAVAANITCIGVLATVYPKTSNEFIDKWVAISRCSNIEPIIIFNKSDSVEEGSYDENQKLYSNLDIKTFLISAKLHLNLEPLTEFLANQTAIFVGNSGSGKSTLTSALTGEVILARELSNNQGVHTTSVSTLYSTDKKFKLIDSPGVRDIGIEHLLAKDILHGFSEIENLASSCAYPKCSHQEDDGCAVMEALNNDEIAQSRYNNFMTIVQSSNYGE